MRYYLIDKVTELELGERARGVKCVTLTDEVLHDHFPDYPMLPGALIVEAAAQLAGFLLEMTFNRRGRAPAARAAGADPERQVPRDGGPGRPPGDRGRPRSRSSSLGGPGDGRGARGRSAAWRGPS